jgi:hypothetical protein
MVLLIFIMLISTAVIHQIGAYQSPDLIGTWISKESGLSVTFQEDGQVLVEGKSYTPKYILTKPNQMFYTIEDKTFVMEYALEGRELYWFIEGENEEVFSRK